METPATSPHSSTSFHPVAQRLRNKGVQRVAILDDLYDLPQPADFDGQKLLEFITAVLDVEAIGELDGTRADGKNVEVETDIDEAVLAELMRKHEEGELGALETPFERHLLPTIRDKRKQLEPLEYHFEHDLGLEVLRFGQNQVDEFVNAVATKEIPIVFMDLYLVLDQKVTSSDQEMDSIKAAVSATRQLYKTCPKERRPLIVLMSSNPNAPEYKDYYRDQSGVLGGLFYFESKEHLVDPGKLFFSLDMFASALPLGHQVQDFVEALEAAISSAADKCRADMRKLSMDDYVFIQMLSLQTDGHPLGDYLMWLTGAYLNHLLRGKWGEIKREESEIQERIHLIQSLHREKKRMDEMQFDEFILSPSMPSVLVAEMFKSAVFDLSVGPVEIHPWTSDSDLGTERTEIKDTESIAREISSPEQADKMPAGDEDVASVTTLTAPAGFPLLDTGDLFFRNVDNHLLLVINAACDLTFTPGGERKPDPARSILLLRGCLHPISKPVVASGSGTRTELFEHEQKVYRIEWDTKQVESHPFQNVYQSLQARNYRRIGRLRLPYALEVQRAFAGDLTRIGMPVPPPIYQPLRVRLFRKGGSKHVEVASLKTGAVFHVLTRSEGQQCICTPELVHQLRRELGRQVTFYHDRAAGGSTKAQKKADTLEQLLEDYEEWRKLLVPFKVGKNGAKKVNGRVLFEYNPDVNASWSRQEDVLVEIREMEIPVGSLGEFTSTAPSRSHDHKPEDTAKTE